MAKRDASRVGARSATGAPMSQATPTDPEEPKMSIPTDANFLTAALTIPSYRWTVVSRPKRGRYCRPVGNVEPGPWAEMRTRIHSGFLFAHPDTEFWLVPVGALEAGRVPIHWDAKPDHTLD